MGKIKKYILAIPLKKSIRLTFFVTFFCICIFSAFTIWWMNRIQVDICAKKEYSINPIDNIYDHEPFTKHEAIIYYSCDVAMVGLPIMYLFLGMVISSRIFYRLKLSKPLDELKKAISMTAANDLDFSISYNSEDELGSLCWSMEQMRKELCKSNEKEWELLQQRRLMNASVAHDLRTPLTILKGYLDYLKNDVGEKNVSDQEICIVLHGMKEAVSRLEQYVDCIRDIDRLENLRIQKQTENVDVIIQELKRAICPLGGSKKVEISCHLSQKEICIDKQMLIRMTENLTQNAVRYAKSMVIVELWKEEQFLVVCVQDDGIGFQPKEQNLVTNLFYTTEKESHFGIGLNICKIICDKMEGTLTLKNREVGGACVIARIKLA